MTSVRTVHLVIIDFIILSRQLFGMTRCVASRYSPSLNLQTLCNRSAPLVRFGQGPKVDSLLRLCTFYATIFIFHRLDAFALSASAQHPLKSLNQHHTRSCLAKYFPYTQNVESPIILIIRPTNRVA